MEAVDGVKGVAHVIDPKSLPKEQLYGRLDPTTLEWTDGIFTATLRKILNGLSTARHKARHWIVFDGDVDPDWAENLNSVLDDNKLLTLPNGERLRIPPSVRIVFEVDTLKSATLATVSRCGMVWFSESTLSISSICKYNIARLAGDAGTANVTNVANVAKAVSRETQTLHNRYASRQFSVAGAMPGVMDTVASFESKGSFGPVDETGELRASLPKGRDKKSVAFGAKNVSERDTFVRETAKDAVSVYFGEGKFVMECLERAKKQFHIMAFSEIRGERIHYAIILCSLFACFSTGIVIRSVKKGSCSVV